MSSGWFDCTEPSLTTSLQGKQGTVEEEIRARDVQQSETATSVPPKCARVEFNFPSPSDDEDVLDTGLTKELKRKVRIISTVPYLL